jgi:hypothetical protein
MYFMRHSKELQGSALKTKTFTSLGPYLLVVDNYALVGLCQVLTG